MRKGQRVRYIGSDTLMKGNTYRVVKKNHNHILIYAPVVYMNGEVHNEACYKSICDFEVVKEV